MRRGERWMGENSRLSLFHERVCSSHALILDGGDSFKHSLVYSGSKNGLLRNLFRQNMLTGFLGLLQSFENRFSNLTTYFSKSDDVMKDI
ncbi:hypothetical protein CEXT_528431 [Caerostris extrusa]|uniref:Uncharacterized protein n=1 Tax=Caerostris extrusa TaxID=172846 RepID=A0AAV4PT39_CAEEX|nr:hypothetical protein CEXT_528431 [Caerostris extrusa]